MTRTEKLILLNQYEILKRVDPKQEEDCDLLIQSLLSGYEKDFEQLCPEFDEPLPNVVYTEVRDILQMYRALGPRWQGREQTKPAAKFIGFDGNDESAHYAYARFLLEDRGLWRESKRDDYNTHYPVLDDYRRMLAVWHMEGRSFELPRDAVDRIVELAPNGSVEEDD